MRKRNKQIVIRLTDEEYKALKTLVERSKIKQNDFIIANMFNKPINVIDGLENILVELKRIGNNLNQLTREVHQGRINCSDELNVMSKEVHNIWQLLKSLKVAKR